MHVVCRDDQRKISQCAHKSELAKRWCGGGGGGDDGPTIRIGNEKRRRRWVVEQANKQTNKQDQTSENFLIFLLLLSLHFRFLVHGDLSLQPSIAVHEFALFLLTCCFTCFRLSCSRTVPGMFLVCVFELRYPS